MVSMCALARAMEAVDKLERCCEGEGTFKQSRCLSQETAMHSLLAIAMTGQVAVAVRCRRSKFDGSASPHFTFSTLCSEIVYAEMDIATTRVSGGDVG